MSSPGAGVARGPYAIDPSRRACEATPVRTLPDPQPSHASVRSASIRPTSPLELALDAISGPHRPLIVWGLFWGARPFSELMRHVPDITKKALRRELADMERLGLVCRELCHDGGRRAEYSLSPLGQTLRPAVGALYEWGLLRLGLDRGLRAALPGAEPVPRRDRAPDLPDDVRPDGGRPLSGKESSR